MRSTFAQLGSTDGRTGRPARPFGNIGYNSLALPIAADVFKPWGLTLRPEIAAISMSGSSVLVAVNALSLKRFPLPTMSRRDSGEDLGPATSGRAG